jgi:hypothetical protein
VAMVKPWNCSVAPSRHTAPGRPKPASDVIVGVSVIVVAHTKRKLGRSPAAFALEGLAGDWLHAVEVMRQTHSTRRRSEVIAVLPCACWN